MTEEVLARPTCYTFLQSDFFSKQHFLENNCKILDISEHAAIKDETMGQHGATF